MNDKGGTATRGVLRSTGVKVLLVLLGSVVGAWVGVWNNRAKPEIQISGVSFETVMSKDEAVIDIPEKTRDLSRKSDWFHTLGETIVYSQLETKLKEDLGETVEQLELLSQALPTLIAKLEEGPQIYRDHVRDNVDELTLKYLAWNVAGPLTTGELKLPPPGDTKPADDDGGSTVSRALALIAGEDGDDSLKALRFVQRDLSEQTTLNRKLLDALKSLLGAYELQLKRDYFTQTDRFHAARSFSRRRMTGFS